MSDLEAENARLRLQVEALEGEREEARERGEAQWFQPTSFWRARAQAAEALARQAQEERDRASAVLNYVADMTFCGADAEWHFKAGYDPQHVLDALNPEPRS